MANTENSKKTWLSVMWDKKKSHLNQEQQNKPKLKRAICCLWMSLIPSENRNVFHAQVYCGAEKKLSLKEVSSSLLCLGMRVISVWYDQPSDNNKHYLMKIVIQKEIQFYHRAEYNVSILFYSILFSLEYNIGINVLKSFRFCFARWLQACSLSLFVVQQIEQKH